MTLRTMSCAQVSRKWCTFGVSRSCLHQSRPEQLVGDQYENTINHGLSTIYGCHSFSEILMNIGRYTHGEENVASNHDCKREDHCPIPTRNLPTGRHKTRREDNHGNDKHEGDEERQPKALGYLRYLEPEVRTLDLLLGCTPCDVVRKQVRQKGL